MERASHGTPGRSPWWLEDDETCTVCLAAYAYEVERRCAACDRGLCADCAVVVRERGEVLCGDCAEAAARGEVEG